MLLDIDALNAAEAENWVLDGATVRPARLRPLPDQTVPGGAVVVREFYLLGRSS